MHVGESLPIGESGRAEWLDLEADRLESIEESIALEDRVERLERFLAGLFAEAAMPPTPADLNIAFGIASDELHPPPRFASSPSLEKPR